jgi:hypothetical protein
MYCGTRSSRIQCSGFWRPWKRPGIRNDRP